MTWKPPKITGSLAAWFRKLNPIVTHHVAPPPEPPIQKFLDWWRWGIASTLRSPGIIAYSQGSARLAGEHLKPGTLPLATDCSGLTYVFADWAGLSLPYDGVGNTDSLVNQCWPVAMADALPGDLIIYGRIGATHHVVTILERISASDFWCGSHGSVTHPCRKVTHSAEVQSQMASGHPGVTFRRIPR